MQTDNGERIERYLRGLMTDDEAAIFKQDIKNDAQLRSDVQVMATMIKRWEQQINEKTQDVVADAVASEETESATHRAAASVSTENETNTITPTIEMKRNPFKRLLSLAAMIAVLIAVALGGLHYYGVNKTSKLFAQNYQPPTNTDVVAKRGGGQAAQELKELFDKIGTQSGKDLSLVIYQLQQAYKQVETSYDYGLYMYDIEWYMALGYVKKNELGKARQLLEAVIERRVPDNPYLEQEIELYKEIQNLYFL